MQKDSVKKDLMIGYREIDFDDDSTRTKTMPSAMNFDKPYDLPILTFAEKLEKLKEAAIHVKQMQENLRHCKEGLFWALREQGRWDCECHQHDRN